MSHDGQLIIQFQTLLNVFINKNSYFFDIFVITNGELAPVVVAITKRYQKKKKITQVPKHHLKQNLFFISTTFSQKCLNGLGLNGVVITSVTNHTM